MKKICFLTLATALTILAPLTSSAEKTPTKCGGLVTDLRTMEKAQAQILESMVNQTKEVSQTLKQFSEKSSYPKQELQNASAAFLTHHEREQKIVTSFQLQSDGLVEKIAECLRLSSN